MIQQAMTAVQRVLAGAVLLGALGLYTPTQAADESIDTFTLGVTGELGNLPWVIAQRRGDLAQLESQYQLRLEILRFSGESDAMQAFARGDIDAVTSSLPAMVESVEQRNRDAHVLLFTGFSRGAHGIISRSAPSVNALRGREIHVPLSSGSHYLLFRILEHAQIDLDDVRLINTPERTLARAMARGEVDTAVAAGATLAQLRNMDELMLVGDSRSLNNELITGMMVDGDVIRDQPELGQLLVSAWFSVIDSLTDGDERFAPEALEMIVDLSGLRPEVLDRYIEYVDFLTRPEHAQRLMHRDNLNGVIAALRRFRRAARLKDCVGPLEEPCIFWRNPSVIENRDGTQLHLNTQFLEELVEVRRNGG